MRISDWSSDVCSSDLGVSCDGEDPGDPGPGGGELTKGVPVTGQSGSSGQSLNFTLDVPSGASNLVFTMSGGSGDADLYVKFGSAPTDSSWDKSEEHTSELQSLMRISYAVFCLKKK